MYAIRSYYDLVVAATALLSSEYCYAGLHENADLLAAFAEGLSRNNFV